ncbi:sialidase family protein [Phytoactinopolyspora endophytica]|uniref:sialidase family protein n=1 Tax=Phytoactinopolyspora endophytica TaxID=1642495 RepID=UPI0013EC062F|nr:sialidase family protein [Phytoactinopolyspora endophytica]
MKNVRRRLQPRLLALGTFGAIVSLLAMVFSGPPRANAESLTSEVTVHSDTTLLDGDGIRTPDIISTSPTNVVTAWREGNTSGQFDNGAIKYANSTDGGQTWSAPKTLAAKDSTHGWHYVILYRVDSDLYAFLGRAPASSHNGQPVTNFMKKSTDGGQTWQDHAVSFANVPDGFVVAGRPLYHNGYHTVPFWKGGQVAVMRSTDMVNWTAGSYAPDPLDTRSGENQLVVDQDDPNKLIMFNRVAFPAEDYVTGPVYTSRTESTDGGLTWSPLELDTNIPNMGTKGYVTKDSNGQYLAIYNTMGGRFPSPIETRPEEFRAILNYKVKKPDQPWGPGRFLADGPEVVDRPHSAGWDTYAMADEYAPGKYFVVWEHDTSAIKVAKLDISDAFTGINENWDDGDTISWDTAANGGSAGVTSGRLELSNAAGTTTSVEQEHAYQGTFIAAFSGKITSATTLDPATGTGANLKLEVANGSRLLAMTVQSDGIYAKVAGSSDWQLVHATSIGTGDHHYRVVVQPDGTAQLYLDSIDTDVEWQTPLSSEPIRTTLSTSGTSTEPAGASVNWVSVEENLVSTMWNDLTGWDAFQAGGSINPAGELRIASPSTGQNAISKELPDRCDFSVDFRAEVTDYSTLNQSNGFGASLAMSVTNRSRRLMLAIQQDGVYTIKKGESSWSRIYQRNNAGDRASWRVDTSSGGEAKLFRNGADTGASWTIQDRDSDPAVRLWSSGNNGDASAFQMDWMRVTCEIR